MAYATRKIADYGRRCVFGAGPRRGASRQYELHCNRLGQYLLVSVLTSPEGKVRREPCDGGDVYTVFTKDAKCGRGEYVEELDILIGRDVRHPRAMVRKIAEAAIAAEYEAGLRVSKMVARFGRF